MNKDIFCTVKELLYSRDCVIMGNAVNNEGRLYDDSFENLTAILAMQGQYDTMRTALQSMVLNYAQTGRVTDDFVADVARMMNKIGEVA